MTAKVLFAGKTHVTAGPNGAAHSQDGFLDIKLPESQNLFGAAWSACYIGALHRAAALQKIKLPTEPSVDAEIKLNLDGSSFFLTAHLDVSIPGIEREVAQSLIEAAHGICPYSKATHGNIDVVTTLA